MQIDRHIAIWAGWVAGPAIGVALMAAPEYLKLGEWAPYVFWGGLIVFVATLIVVVCSVALPSGRGRAWGREAQSGSNNLDGCKRARGLCGSCLVFLAVPAWRS